MTNAQKWVFAFLILFIALFALSRLVKEEETGTDSTEYYSKEDGELSGGETDALTLINKQGCVRCHGADLNGTGLAPSLMSIKEYWDRDDLINYLRNPSSYSGDERFEAYKKQYNTLMPSYNNVDVKDLGKIADYLLSDRRGN